MYPPCCVWYTMDQELMSDDDVVDVVRRHEHTSTVCRLGRQRHRRNLRVRSIHSPFPSASLINHNLLQRPRCRPERIQRFHPRSSHPRRCVRGGRYRFQQRRVAKRIYVGGQYGCDSGGNGDGDACVWCGWVREGEGDVGGCCGCLVSWDEMSCVGWLLICWVVCFVLPWAFYNQTSRRALSRLRRRRRMKGGYRRQVASTDVIHGRILGRQSWPQRRPRSVVII